MIPPDGLHGHDDYPDNLPVLAGPPKEKPSWAVPVGDAMTREEYLRIGRPLLIRMGFLKPDPDAASREELAPKVKRLQPPVMAVPVTPPPPAKVDPVPEPEDPYRDVPF